ncbi:MAG TPA: hypothetical protein VJA27_02435 [Patescibacteria group bacterium]|nr:hypothetical protein [Patescibacteria group bacterium]
MKTCPACAAKATNEAAACPKCASDLTAVALNTLAPYGVRRWTYNKYILLAVLFPPAGIVVGINFLSKPSAPKEKLGESILVWALFACFVYYIIWKVKYQ